MASLCSLSAVCADPGHYLHSFNVRHYCPVEIYLKFALDMLWLIGVMALGGGGLYLGKRLNEGRVPGASQIISPPGNTVSGDTGAAAPDPVQPGHQRTGGYRGIP
jgi:hypothetical protein